MRDVRRVDLLFIPALTMLRAVRFPLRSTGLSSGPRPVLLRAHALRVALALCASLVLSCCASAQQTSPDRIADPVTPTAAPVPANAPAAPPPMFTPEDVIAPVFPGREWSTATPESQGFSSAQLKVLIKEIHDEGSTSGMIIHAGHVIAQWGDVTRKNNLYSARKSVLSALIGIAVARSQIHLDDTLAQIGIDDEPPALTTAEKQATIRTMLEARSGVYHPTVFETTGMIAAKPARGSHAPGTLWVYNNWDFNTLGTIYMRQTHQDLFKAVKREIATPLGMQDFQASDGWYVSGMPETRYPAYPMRMSSRDFARFALLYLHQGKWKGRQIVPASWVVESTHPYSNVGQVGYGYLWWTNAPAQGPAPKGPIMAWADGHLGQYAVVIPSRDLVIVSQLNPDWSIKEMDQLQMRHWVAQVEAIQTTPSH